ncbi:MAG: VOC family protein [Hellea sp.]
MGLALVKQNVEDERPDLSIGHIGLRVRDLKKSSEFFKLVGARTVFRMPSMAILELRGGTHLILRRNKNAQSADASFDLMVDDVEEMRQRLIAAGYSPSGISRGGVHRSFNVIEPSGVRLEFTSSHATGPV